MDENLGVPSPPDDNPEMSRRGAFAAGGLALAALVAGGCGWLAMNAKKGEEGLALTATLADGIGTESFPGAVYQEDDAKEMFDAGISASLVRYQLGSDSRNGARNVAYADEGAGSESAGGAAENAADAASAAAERTSYVKFDVGSMERGVPYLIGCDVYADEWAAIEDFDGDGPVDRDENGNPGYVRNRKKLRRVGAAIVPDGSAGSVTVPFAVPEGGLGENTRLTLRTFWQRLDIH